MQLRCLETGQTFRQYQIETQVASTPVVPVELLYQRALNNQLLTITHWEYSRKQAVYLLPVYIFT